MTRRVFAEHGLQPACSLGLSLDADISSADAEVVARGAAELDNALTFAAGIGSRHLCGILYSALGKYPGPPTAEGRANAIAELRKLATKAADSGVRLCLEVVNRCAGRQMAALWQHWRCLAAPWKGLLWRSDAWGEHSATVWNQPAALLCWLGRGRPEGQTAVPLLCLPLLQMGLQVAALPLSRRCAARLPQV